MTDREDREIIEAVVDGEVDSFEKLVRKYEGMVFAIASRHVPTDQVEEVGHDAFLRAYRSLENYRFEKPFENWLARLTVRACCDFWRREKRRREIPAAFFAEHAEWVQDVLSERAVEEFRSGERGRQARELLDWALGQLSAEDRLVLSLVYLEGHAVNRAAEMLGWSVAKTKVRSHRARLTLRKRLSKLLDKAGGFS